VKTDLECLPCFFRQIRRTLSYAGVNGDRGRAIVRRAEKIIDDASFDQPPARITTLLHRLMREATGVDPYGRIKDEYNRIALDMLPVVRKMAEGTTVSDEERLAGGVRAAIAGNIIDFGIYDSIDLERSLHESFAMPLPIEIFQEFSQAVREADRVLYLCDNAGEIVFDRVLIEILRERGKHVTAAVKGVPVINDATVDDASAARLMESASEVIDNGNDGIGTLLELCSPNFLEAYGGADMIISKGQANYETLASENDDRLFFLFMVKCPVVARELGRANGDIILRRSRPSRTTLRG
jgi:uncharacterized protein with ATP-grasp and redox domains